MQSVIQTDLSQISERISLLFESVKKELEKSKKNLTLAEWLSTVDSGRDLAKNHRPDKTIGLKDEEKGGLFEIVDCGAFNST